MNKNITAILIVQIFFLSAGLWHQRLAHADDDFLKKIEGYYSAPANYCTVKEQGKLISCAADVRDCMSIKALNKTSAQIAIQSFQTNGHECGISGVATLVDGELIYVGSGVDVDDNGHKIAIALKDGKFGIRYLGGGNPEMTSRLPFCAFQASMERVKFALTDKADVTLKSCP